MKIFSKLFQGDKVIWMIVALLALTSLLAVYSATGTYANTRYAGNNTYVLLRHAATLFIGLVAVYIAHLPKYTFYTRLLYLLLFVSVPLLIYTLAFGVDLNDAQRTIRIFGISFQSSDFAKVALIGYLSRELTVRQDRIHDFKQAFLPLMIPILLVVGLIFPENFSTAAMLFVACMVLLFVGRINMKYLMIFIGGAVLVMSLYIIIVLNVAEDRKRTGLWLQRVENYIESFKKDDDKDAAEIAKQENEEDYQIIQSKIAIAGGGLLGKGPGRSTQRNFLPHPYSDFIYALIIEEYGLIGGAVVMLLYLVLLYRTVLIMTAMPQSYAGFLSFGLAFLMAFQAMINMGVAVGILPVTGQPLPFVSMGGSSLMFTGFSIGIILSVSKEVNKSKEKEKGNENEIEAIQDNN